ncbi:uncharacterized protein J4E88_000993 [Alternaria novae-zelandiae]|uniref:uncharacterized protein n=1 Tax=Alternaria novae-zelandiae TaxID=430562 RepID=UPI0020C2BDC1|nr:uncharacterized protein J4E88_000993 [Alternaria novae-zelandiae]KAI4696814.1 hypothetical protein J4E88_000993 [Alternaria novae-zelandiae]
MERPSSTAVEVATAMSETTPTNTLTSPLLRLPAELRNKVYTYVGHSEQIHIAATITNSNPSKFTMQFHLPGLLSTCQQTRSEATALVYAQITIDTIPGDAWYWLYSKRSHSLCAHVTCLHISEWFANLIEREVDKRLKDSQDAKCCTLDLPRLERVRVICRGWNVDFWCEYSRKAIRKWFGKESLVIVFETGVDTRSNPPDSLLEKREMFRDYSRSI